MVLTAGSLFAGIGGFDLAMQRAGIDYAWQVEIDKACQSVLARHFPETVRYADVKTVGRDNLATVDLICGGFPCQDLSIAGRRAGLAGERSGLWHEFHRIIKEIKPGWVVIENVPGLLSSNGGRDFAVILRGLVKFGYGVAWRVLDAQYFGVAQRRRRVFIVASLGNGSCAQVLFEPESITGYPAPSRKAGQEIARTVEIRPDENSGGLLAFGGNNTSGPIEIFTAVNAAPTRRYDFESETFVAFNLQQNDVGNHKRKDRPNGGMYVKETDTALTVGSTDMTLIAWQNHQQSGKIRIQKGNMPTLCRKMGTDGNNVPMIAFDSSGDGSVNDPHITPTMKHHGDGPKAKHAFPKLAVVSQYGIRRLTPVECERLQGFPDGWTAGQSDSERYRQLGNAVAVPVVEWIMKRIVTTSPTPLKRVKGGE